jgi:hypothetical protein
MQTTVRTRPPRPWPLLGLFGGLVLLLGLAASLVLARSGGGSLTDLDPPWSAPGGTTGPGPVARGCAIEDGTHDVGRPELVDGRRIRGRSAVTFGCRPGLPGAPYDHGTLTVTIRQYRGLGFWSRKARKVEEFKDITGTAEASYTCDGDGSQLYQVQSLASIDLKGEDGPFPGGTWFKDSAEVRLRC